jgi:hypothetical protein
MGSTHHHGCMVSFREEAKCYRPFHRGQRVSGLLDDTGEFKEAVSGPDLSAQDGDAIEVRQVFEVQNCLM